MSHDPTAVGPVRSSRLLALPNPLSRGLVPVRLVGGALLPDRSGCLLAGQLAIEAEHRLLCVFCFVENGQTVVAPTDEDGPVTDGLVKLAVLYFGDPSVRSLIDGMVGPLRTWDDLEAANLLIEEVIRSMALAPQVG